MLRFTGPVVLIIAAAAHAEIAAPPVIKPDPAPETSESPALMESHAAPPLQNSLTPTSSPSTMAVPIEFDALEVEVEDNPAYAPSLMASQANVQALEQEMTHAMENGDPAGAEKLFNQILRLAAPEKQKRNALLLTGRNLEEKQKQPAKAAVVYEQFVNLFPTDPESPDTLLRLGRIYRDNGAYGSAFNKFYSVLYSSLQVKTGEEYTDSSLRAKLEIAHTHFAAGDYKAAAELYSRLKLVKMTQAEASEVAFRSAYISYLSGQYTNSLTGAEGFLVTYPASPLAPEAQYLRVQSLRALGRKEEAMKETIKLLQAGREFGKKKPAVWAYWQRKTGNDIANELYETGDTLGALSVYQKLAELNDAPNWRGPTVYQIGLCFERLRHHARAREAYRYIIDKIPLNAPAVEGDSMVGMNLSTLRDMAQWRLDNLDWLEKTERDLYPLLDKETPASDLQPAFLKTEKSPPKPAPSQSTQQAANQIAPPNAANQ
ncbi:MAG: tetratricopeptide repeat protein [bacterium]